MRLEARLRSTAVRYTSVDPGFRGCGIHGRARTARVGSWSCSRLAADQAVPRESVAAVLTKHAGALQVGRPERVVEQRLV